MIESAPNFTELLTNIFLQFVNFTCIGVLAICVLTLVNYLFVISGEVEN